MPPVVIGAAASALVAGSTFAAGALAIGFSLSTFAGTLVLGGLSYALTDKQKLRSTSSQPTTSTTSVRQSDLTRQYVYGHTRVTRGYAAMQSTGLNGELHSILMLCQGELRAINEIWLNDYCVHVDDLDSSGRVIRGRYANKLTIRMHLGSDNQEADPVAINNIEGWFTDHRLSGIAYLYIIMEKDQDVYPTGLPNISAVVEGPSFYDPRIGQDRWSTNVALYCHDWVRSEKGYGAFADDIDEDNVSAQANICDEIVDIVYKDHVATSSNGSNNSITLDGELLSLQFGDRVKLVGSLPSGLSENVEYFIIPYQVKDTPRVKLATSLNNAMNKVEISIGSTEEDFIIRHDGEPRYHGSGVVDSADTLSQTLNNLTNSMAGRSICVAGAWTFLAGAWRTPTENYGIGDIRGSGYGIKNSLSMSESYNVVKGLFISPLTLYQTTDYPIVRFPYFIDQDNGLESTREINLPFTTRPTTAQRIAKIELFRGRQDISYQSDFSMKGMKSQPGDVVSLTLDRMGWENKNFEVTEFSFNVNQGALSTNLGLRETAQEIYDWSMGEAIDFDPAPNTNLPNPFLVQVPNGVSYDSRFIETRNGDSVYTIILSWLPHPNAFVISNGLYEVQYKLSSSNVWRPSFMVEGSIERTDVVDASVNTLYDIRIRAINSLGVRSQWVIIYNAVVGNSGESVESEDWGLVTETPSEFEDWGIVTETPSEFEDWEFVN